MAGNTEVLEWAGQSLGGAVLGTVAGIGIQQAMLALGIAPDSVGPIRDALNRIAEKLDTLVRGVWEINKRVADLSEQLKESTLDIKADIVLSDLRTAMTLIETHYTGSSGSQKSQSSTGSLAARSLATADGPAIVSFSELVRRKKATSWSPRRSSGHSRITSSSRGTSRRR